MNNFITETGPSLEHVLLFSFPEKSSSVWKSPKMSTNAEQPQFFNSYRAEVCSGAKVTFFNPTPTLTHPGNSASYDPRQAREAR